jgi:PAT family beta-lactamase induction signal transducer AmpG
VGEAIEIYGYANIFYVTAGLGMVAVLLVLIEMWRPAPAPSEAVSAEPVEAN